jgi:aminoglycoside 3-N-acetyltransferase
MHMIRYRELIQTFRSFPIRGKHPVLLHVSDRTTQKIQGGLKTLMGTLRESYPRLMMPSFTYQTMVYPKTGPPDNGLEYNTPPRDNREALFFHPRLPVSPEVGAVPEAFRKLSDVHRSTHPILSFSGCQVNHALQSQTLSQPYAPLAALAKKEGWVLLIDQDQTSNFTIHYALNKGGRELFTRWALTSAGVKTCPHFPGCEKGFNTLASYLRGSTHHREIETIHMTAVPIQTIFCKVQALLNQDPFALLCDQEHCLKCSSVRARLQQREKF